MCSLVSCTEGVQEYSAEEDYKMRSFMICTPHQILFRYHLNEMDGTCSIHDREVGCIQVTIRDHLEDTGVDGRIILKWIFKKWDRHGLDCSGFG